MGNRKIHVAQKIASNDPLAIVSMFYSFQFIDSISILNASSMHSNCADTVVVLVHAFKEPTVH